MSQRVSVPFDFIAGFASEFGAVEVEWRESCHSFTGFVAVCWFDSYPGDFARRWSRAVGYQCFVRDMAVGHARWAVSVPCIVPVGQVQLSSVSRGSRVQLVW